MPAAALQTKGQWTGQAQTKVPLQTPGYQDLVQPSLPCFLFFFSTVKVAFTCVTFVSRGLSSAATMSKSYTREISLKCDTVRTHPNNDTNRKHNQIYYLFT